MRAESGFQGIHVYTQASAQMPTDLAVAAAGAGVSEAGYHGMRCTELIAHAAILMGGVDAAVGGRGSRCLSSSDGGGDHPHGSSRLLAHAVVVGAWVTGAS